jgi:hypothetical protein
MMNAKDKLIKKLEDFVEFLIKGNALFNHIHNIIPMKDSTETETKFRKEIADLKKQIEQEKKQKK